MSQPRVEKVADEIIAADAARAQATGRAGKPDTNRPEEPPPGVVTLGGIPEAPRISPTIDLTADPTVTPPTIDLTEDLTAPPPPDPPYDSSKDEAELAEFRRQHPEWTPDMGFPIKETDDDEPAAPAEPEPAEPPVAALTTAGLAKEPRGEDVVQTSQRARIVVVAVTAAIVLAVIGLSLSGYFGGQGPGATAGPGASGAPTTTPTPEVAGPPPCEVAAALRTLPGLTAVDEAKLCGFMSPDRPADQVEYDGSAAGITPKEGDILAAGIGLVNFTDEQAERLASMCGAGKPVRCNATKPAAGTYLMYSIEGAAPAAGVSGAFWETGIGFFDASPEPSGATEPFAGAPADVFTGNNTLYTTRFGSIPTIDTYGPFRLIDTGPPPFLERPSGTFDFVSGNVVIGFIPSAEWDGAKTYRFFSYYSTNDNSARAVDEAPDFNMPAIAVPATISIIELH